MSAARAHRYVFATKTQWDACVIVGADRRTNASPVRPFAPYAVPGVFHESRGAHSPVMRWGETLWCDEAGVLHRLSVDGEIVDRIKAPSPIGRSSRLVSTLSGLWSIGERPGSLQLHEAENLSRLLDLKIEGSRIADIAGAEGGAVWALRERGGQWHAIKVNPDGRLGKVVTLPAVSQARALAYLRDSRRFVVMTSRRILWLDARTGNVLENAEIGALHPCFAADALGSDGRGRVFVAGTDGKEAGGRSWLLSFDEDGQATGQLPVEPADTPCTGIAARGDALAITGRRGLLRFKATDAVPDGGEARCIVITPVLISPDREDARRWLRVEATANLPEGATLELAYAATDDESVRDRLRSLVEDKSVSGERRTKMLLEEPDLWQGAIVFHGSDATTNGASEPFSAPLFDVKKRFLCVRITLIAAPGAKLPEISKLAVLYPGRSLMELLPSIYRREEAQPGSFMRVLVGVLETTTQGLDARIEELGSRVHPSTAPADWLDFVARWLGLPWDDGLGEGQKRAIVSHAAELARKRGTRVGLELLLECLLPGTPRRFRVTDQTADFGFATVGGGCCEGSALPAMLGGVTRWHTELDATVVLGASRLPCAGQLEDGAWQFAGRVRVEVAASAGERESWGSWLRALIASVMPVTARLELRWVTARALRTNSLDGFYTLESPPAPYLGTDAIAGVARLPEGTGRLSSTGLDPGSRLR